MKTSKKKTTKKAPAKKKAVAKKSTAKKTVAKKNTVKKSKVKLTNFTIGATIPTMSYGNIQPMISVEAPSIEEAKAVVLPVIEDLYARYAVTPLIKAEKVVPKVTVTEKVVEVPAENPTPKEAVAAKKEEMVAEKPKEEVIPSPTPVKTEADTLSDELEESPAFTKAKKAITNAFSLDALSLIENQIQKSIKLTESEKPLLLSEVLKKRRDLKTA